MPNDTIQIRGLCKRFDDVVAVDDLTLEVAAGEIFGLVGPDGAGKTAVLRMMAGIMSPTQALSLSRDAMLSNIPKR